MAEKEFFEHILPLELHPRWEEIKLWRGMKPFSLTGCDRIIITSGAIEFQCNRECYTFSLEEESFFINYRFYSPVSYN